MQNILKKQCGFTLLEVLISMMILSIGLLGLGGLQIASLKGTGNAHSRNVANMLALELADRMRANPNGVEGGFYDDAVDCNAGITVCRTNTFCTAQQVAIFDLQEIDCGTGGAGGITNLLVGGSLQIVCPAGTCATAANVRHAQHDITISWSERNSNKKQENNVQARTFTVPVIP